MQYQASTNTWRFAEHQYDYIGNKSNGAIDNWIDIFPYGTSGYDGKYPNMSGNSSSDYFTSNISGTNYDWGIYNGISNGGNKPGIWRTLTYDEWNYLLNTRKNASDKRECTTIDDVYGWVLLPDNWEQPKRVSLGSNLTIRQWEKLEAAGAVFLPYDSKTESFYDNHIEYWTGTVDNQSDGGWPHSIKLSDFIVMKWNFFGERLAVRLVCDGDKCDVLKLK